jgi:phosphopentomutase
MTYGHRNDVKGYGQKLEEFDAYVPAIREKCGHDFAMIVADHGVDPTTESTDHSREYIPLLVFGNRSGTCEFGHPAVFADVQPLLVKLSGKSSQIGTSFFKEILR